MGVTTVSPILTIDIALPLQALQLVDHSRFLSRLFTITRKQMDCCRNDYLERFELPGWPWRIPCDQASNEKDLNPVVKLSIPHSPLLSSLIPSLKFNDTQYYPRCGFRTPGVV